MRTVAQSVFVCHVSMRSSLICPSSPVKSTATPGRRLFHCAAILFLPAHLMPCIGVKIAEGCALPAPGQAGIADPALAVLAHQNLGGACVRRVGVVELVPIDERDHVGILLNGAGAVH